MSKSALQFRSDRLSRVARRVAAPSLALMFAACAADAVMAPTAAESTPSSSLSVATTGSIHQCIPDSKFIGLIELSTADVPGTWWYLTRQGFDAAGITDYLAFLEFLFGQDFADLNEATATLVGAVVPFDVNGNGYVCAYDVRGTRANFRQPNVSLYLFGVKDDNTGR